MSRSRFADHEPYIVGVLLALYGAWLINFAGILSISPDEAKLLYEGRGFLASLVQGSIALFGQSDQALRAPLIVIHLLNLMLFWIILRQERFSVSDRLWSLATLMLLPGLNSAALIITKAALLMSGALWFILLYTHPKSRQLSYVVLAILSIADSSLIALNLGLIFYGLARKDRLLTAMALGLFGLGMSLGGANLTGKPRNYFLDIMGAYGAVFSPFVFLWLVYTLYRYLVIEASKPITWYIALAAFLFSLLLSFRQRPPIELFAPFVVLILPWGVVVLRRSIKRRLPMFRWPYLMLAYLLGATLIVNFLATFFNRPFYRMVERPEEHFIWAWDGFRETALKLKAMGINEVESDDPKLQAQLRFYGIGKGGVWYMSRNPQPMAKVVSIRHNGVEIRRYYVTKIHK
ncbi:MAG: hypothetical protein K6347_03840 [Campylobacterales bacterium]